MKRHVIAAFGTMLTALCASPARSAEISGFLQTNGRVEKATVLINNPIVGSQPAHLDSLENSSKSVEDIQKTRLDYLENSSKSVTTVSQKVLY